MFLYKKRVFHMCFAKIDLCNFACGVLSVLLSDVIEC